ncbi:PPC domain-containing DNA-binding protein [Sporosarcina sp. Marseille-Q4943]|uniref:PPC domain-containing DNA-binding protein n=1 Tax=Sporosarcina sp. Marseille-Q4943 TaxID=2942204 RepID=UPI00208DD680|nr:PPC domain-containing DNA-binding protein [Sporosarcina sp. Marseille-Q4943]
MDKRIQAVHDRKSDRIAGRFMKGIDLFEGIKGVCKEFGVEAAQFQCLGSLEYATYVQPDQNKDGTLYYSSENITDSPVELLSGTGFVGLDMEGEPEVHFHGMIVDCNKNITGGHFIDGKNPVAVTIEFILFPLNGIKMQRDLDEFYGIPVFQFREKE